MDKSWADMSPHQRLAMLDLMKATIQAEMDRSLVEMNAFLAAHGVPAEVEIEVRLRIDPNRDPRLERGCRHSHYRFELHGRHCTCGALMVDPGD